MPDSLSDRLDRLEALEALKQLKARYWHACDRKDVEAVRACFADGAIEIDYDGPAGKLEHRDALRDLFANVANRPEIVEIHHGGAPILELLSPTSARGTWSLVYHLMDTGKQTVSHVGGYYEDEYVRVEGAWAIRRARFRVCSAYVTRWKDGTITRLHAGNRLP